MNPPDRFPPLDTAQVHAVLTAVRAQVATALLLSGGMVCAVAALVCVTFRCRRAALMLGFGYALSLCFVPNGHAQILGPVGCAVTLFGFWWPEGHRR